MQLTVSPETTLDIEMNMSSVENIENNKNTDIKNVNLDFNDHNDEKCNGKKDVLDVKEDSKCEESNSATIDHDLAELSNVDWGEIINRKRESLDLKDDQLESQKGATVINGLDSVENDSINVDETKDTLEEDYLEDDIISIQEPFSEITPPEKTSENVLTEDNDKIIIGSTLGTEEDKIEVENTKRETQLENSTTTDDTIEVIEEIDPEQCHKNRELDTQTEDNEDNEIFNTKSHNETAAKDEQEVQLVMQQEEDKPEVTEDLDNSAVDTEMTVILSPKDIDKNDEKESAKVHAIKDNDANGLTVEGTLSTCENSINTIKKSKPDDLEIDVTEKTSPECERETKELKPEEEHDNSHIKKLVNSFVKNALKSIDECTETPDTTLSKNREVSITENLEESPATNENELNSHAEAKESDNFSRPTEQMKINELSENVPSISDVKISNTEAIKSSLVSNDVDTVNETKITTKPFDCSIELKDDMDVEEVLEETKSKNIDNTEVNGSAVNIIDKPIICKLSNTLDILSDDDEEELPEVDLKGKLSSESESSKVELSKPLNVDNKQCINIEDDDDIMLIDEDINKTETNSNVDDNINKETVVQSDSKTDSEIGDEGINENKDLFALPDKRDPTPPPVIPTKELNIDIKEKSPEPKVDKPLTPPPLIPDNFVKTAKKKLSDMTRDELEEFCILKIVESIVDRSSLSDIKNKLKTMAQGLEEYRKKALLLTKQNRDLQVVLKSVQEEQKKVAGNTNTPITPLKITRSVGMQVYMEKTVPRKKGQQQNNNNKNLNNTQNKTAMPQGQGSRPQKPNNQSIPVPRLVPANNPALKAPSNIPQANQMNTPTKGVSSPNGIIKTPPVSMKPEKRQHNKIASSVTVDLTDDEPPSKAMAAGPRTSPAPPVRLVPPQNLMGPQRQPFGTGVNSPRKVYIPISGPQSQTLRPGQTIMLKTVPATGMRPRCPTPQVTRVDPNSVRMNRIAPRHPAPLPFGTRQYQPPNWKSLPPAPDLKLSKVENGIVISWKIEGVPEDSYEEIASYQLYAYQETSQPPSTTLWKKIGDVKALPLPMACTLTQFMAGFKYYFAVRAVDIRSRFGPFSLPGSILLLNKNI